MTEQRSPEANLTLLDATMIGMGAMIGAGIFVLTGLAAELAGPAAILVFALNGAVTAFTGVSYAELASSIPKSGGGYAFVREVFDDLSSFVTGWMLWFAYMIAGALYALGFAPNFIELLHVYGFAPKPDEIGAVVIPAVGVEVPAAFGLAFTAVLGAGRVERRRDRLLADGGRVGFQTAELLDDQGHDVTIVEQDSDTCDRIADEYVATVIEGDASDPEILEQADVERADVVAALTGIAGLNLAVCLEAKQMDDVRTVARIDGPGKKSYERFVDAVTYPERAGARVAANEILGSDVQTLADVTGTLNIMQVRVAEGAPTAGKTLDEVRFPEGTLIVSDTRLTAGNRYVVAVEPDVADEVMNLLRG